MKIAFALALALAPFHAAAQPTPASVARWQPLIERAAARFALPPEWIARVMHAESAGMTMLHGRPIRSSAGAMGLMQLMPATWTEMRSRLALGTNPDDPHDNIMAGAAYLRLMYDRFGYPGLFAAYHAGPGRYAAVLAGRAALPDATRAYLGSVAGTRGTAPMMLADRLGAVVEPPRQMLFVLRYDSPSSRESEAESRVRDGLFVIRNGDQ